MDARWVGAHLIWQLVCSHLIGALLDAELEKGECLQQGCQRRRVNIACRDDAPQDTAQRCAAPPTAGPANRQWPQRSPRLALHGRSIA